MMRVLHVFSGDLWAGAEVMGTTLIEALVRHHENLRLKVLLFNEGIMADRLRKHKIDVTVLDEHKSSFFSLILSAAKLIRSFFPQVVHSHGYKENILSFFASRGTWNLPLVSTIHGLPEIHASGTSIMHQTVMSSNFFLLRHAFANIVSVSNELRCKLIELLRMPIEKITVIHNGIKLPEPNFREEKMGFVIGAGGRLYPVKNYRLFVEIAAIVAKSHGNVFFKLAGDGPEFDKLKKICLEKGLENVFTFLGHVDDMNAFYRELDVYINTSLHEGIPMAVLEAMAQGVPVIAPNIGGLSEIIDNGGDGYLISSHDPIIFAEKCLYLHANKDKRTALGVKAAEKIRKRFSAKKMASGYHQLYRQILI